MKDGFIKISCATPDVRIADCGYNANRIIEITESGIIDKRMTYDEYLEWRLENVEGSLT